MRRAIPLLPQEMREDVEALVSPENLAITAAVLGAWAASHAVGVGEVVDIGLLALGLMTLGAMALDVGKHIGAYLRVAIGAKSPKDLDDAAAHLAEAISMLGVTLFTTLIMKQAAKKLPGVTAKLTPAPLQRYLAFTVEEWLYKSGYRRIAPRARAGALEALRFFETKRNFVSENSILGWLKGMDLSKTVTSTVLPPKQVVIGYMQVNPLILAKIRAHPSRARELIAGLKGGDMEIGRFFTRSGTSSRQLGIGDQNRIYCKFELGSGVSALQSTTAPFRDTWTLPGVNVVKLPSGNEAHRGQLVGGGGMQYLIPDAKDLLKSETLKLVEIGTRLNPY